MLKFPLPATLVPAPGSDRMGYMLQGRGNQFVALQLSQFKFRIDGGACILNCLPKINTQYFLHLRISDIFSPGAPASSFLPGAEELLSTLSPVHAVDCTSNDAGSQNDLGHHQCCHFPHRSEVRMRQHTLCAWIKGSPSSSPLSILLPNPRPFQSIQSMGHFNAIFFLCSSKQAGEILQFSLEIVHSGSFLLLEPAEWVTQLQQGINKGLESHEAAVSCWSAKTSSLMQEKAQVAFSSRSSTQAFLGGPSEYINIKQQLQADALPDLSASPRLRNPTMLQSCTYVPSEKKC
eukprot:scaffold79987_cov17-Tisochrysis_lutea.AAC.2